MRMKEMAIVAALTLCVVPAFAQQSSGSAGQDAALAAKVKEAKDKAAEVTKALTNAAANGQDTQALQSMIDQLKAITDRLSKLEEDVAGMKKQAPSSSPNPLGKTAIGGFTQLQYRASSNPGEFDGFGAKRVRINITNDNDRTHLKISYDFATTQFGSTFNEAPESGGQLRDAWVSYDLEPKIAKATFGRQNIPLGYEIERSDTDREMPERSKYNDTFFNGQRSTGLVYRRMFNPNVEAWAGMMNALSATDPGQRAVTNVGPVGNRLAGVGGVRYKSPKFDAGISTFWGRRHAVRGTAPDVNPTNDRRFTYLDARYSIMPKLTMRAEAMFGHDRIPNQTFTAGDNARDVTGGHVQLAYNIDPMNELAVRYEQFDPNTDHGSDLFHGEGLTWLHFINPNLQLSAAFERFTDETRTANKNWNVTTLRVQYKF